MRCSRSGFTLLESLISMFLLAIVLTLTGLLFHRSFIILRVLDDKERTRQAARLGLDRITSELREATRVEPPTENNLRFEKIDPDAVLIAPTPAPTAPPDDFVPAEYGPKEAYPDSTRLLIEYTAQNEKLIRRVARLTGGPASSQVVVVGVNSFTCTEVEGNPGEFEVKVSVLDNRRVMTLKSLVLCPCIRAEFTP